MHEQKLVTAEAMARAVQFDPQFAMPERPRFPQELVVVPLADGLLFDGADEQQVLRGGATKTLLPRLLPLLDGTRTLERLAAELPDVTAGHVRQAVALLYTRGLLEDAAADPALDPGLFKAQTLAFFRRHVDATRVNRSALQAAQRLLDSEVLVCATGPDQTAARALIAEQLRQAGVGTVGCGSLEPEPGTEYQFTERRGGQLVVVLVAGEDDSDQLSRLDERCARLGIPWLRAAVRPETLTADLGPYFERGETACYQCFARGNVKPQSPTYADGGSPWLWTRLWAGMLVTEVIYLLSRIAPTATGLQVSRYDLADWSMRRWRFPRLPGCAHCRPMLAPEEIGSISTAAVYEDAVRFPSRHLLDPKSHQVHYRASNLELAKEGKRYPSAEKIDLPDPAHLLQLRGTTLEHLPGGPDGARATDRLSRDRLASLLMLSGGVRRDEGNVSARLRRWAPTGGNLGSVELYVAAHNVEGVEPGLYFYQPHEHLLARLSPALEPGGGRDFIRQAVPFEGDEAPDAVIMTVAALHRVSQKYGPFAYRIVNLDAGVALGQLHMVGSSLGLRTRTAKKWADDLITDRLKLADLGEAVTGALFVYGARPADQEG